MVKIHIYNEMKKQNIPEEILSLITEEEINLFQELQIKIKELNNKTNLTRLTDGDDYWVSQVFDSIWPFKAFTNINFDNKKFLDIGNKKGYFNNIGKEIKSLAMEQGLFIRPLGNVIYLLPPLCITDDQLEKSYWIIRKILENL